MCFALLRGSASDPRRLRLVARRGGGGVGRRVSGVVSLGTGGFRGLRHNLILLSAPLLDVADEPLSP